MRSLTIAAFAALALQAAADCPNACSGNGLCRQNDACKCDPGYTGNDCSQRTCPFDLSFVDAPRGDLNHDGGINHGDAGWVKTQWSNTKEFEGFPLGTTGNYAAADGEGHFYAECSGKGECDRQSGECKCYRGYTGAACQRTTCPKDCSGHGVCRTLKEIAGGALNKRVVSGFAGHNYYSGVENKFEYRLWDADKAQACVCDPGFSGVDCAYRQCPRGDDPNTISQQFCGNSACKWEVQSFTLAGTGAATYKIGFTDYLSNTNYAYATVTINGNPNGNGYVADADLSTKLPGSGTAAGQIQAALRNVPGGLLQRVEVYPADSNTATAAGRTFRVTFVGVAGDVDLLTVAPYGSVGGLWSNPDSSSYDPSATASGGNGAVVVEKVRGNYEAIECSGRGLCDGSSGLCKCFNGYFGAACEFLNALSGN